MPHIKSQRREAVPFARSQFVEDPLSFVAKVTLAASVTSPERLTVMFTCPSLSAGKLYQIPHNLYVGVASGIIALLFDMNLTSQNLTVSNGILFGLSLSFLILPKEELQRLLLFFIAPETYHYAYQEMSATQLLEENKVKSEMVNRRSEIDLYESINRAEAAKNESINKIRQLLSVAGKTFVETKYSDIESRINSWNAKLDKKEIDLATYEMQMKRIFEELQETYQDINQ